MSLSNIHPQQIGAQLIRKYEHQFSFYEVRPINQILNGHYDRKTFIDLCDIRIYSQDAEFLRRVYYYHTLTGRQEIDHRLRMCGEYYSNNRVMNYEYPMMVVTNTKSLFMKRDRRLRKIQAGQGSSDQSAQQDKQKILFQPSSYYILDDIDRDSLDQESEDVGEDLEYDSEEHDVFQEVESENREITFTKQQLKKIEQQDVSHLIQDMSERSQPVVEYRGLGTPKINLAQVKFQKDNSISITSIEDSGPKSLNPKQKPSFYQYIAQPMFQKILNLSSFSEKFSHPLTTTYQTKKSAKNEDKQRQERRMKIRSKAEQLLKAVRSREQTQLPLSS